MCGDLFKPSEQTSTQSQTTGPSQQYQDAYTKLLADSQKVADRKYDPRTNQKIAGFTAPQQQAFGNVQANQGIAVPYVQDAASYAQSGAMPSYQNVQSYMSPYQQNVIDATQAQFNTQNARQLEEVRSQAARQGALGGSGRQVAEALTREAQANAQNPVIAGLYNQGYSQAIDNAQADANRSLQASGVMSGLGGLAQKYAANDVNSLLGIGAMQQGLQQSQYDAATANAKARAAYPFQNLSWLSGITTGLGGASGTTTTGETTTPGPSLGQQLIGGGLAALSLFRNGGRVGYETGGGVMPYADAMTYIPDVPMQAGGSGPSPSLAQASGSQGSGGMGEMLNSFKQAQSAFHGLGKLGSAMGMFRRGGSVRPAYADGGDVIDMEPDDENADSWVPAAPVKALPAPAALQAPAAQPSQGSGILGLTDAGRQGLLQAGLGIMASRSPNVGVALGEGGLKGAEAYQAAQTRAKAEALQRERIAQASAALQQRATQASEMMRMRKEQFDASQKLQAAKLAQAEDDRARGELRQVGNELVRIGPDGAVASIYKGEGKGGMDTPEGRASVAAQYGLEPGSDAFQSFVLTGKLPREDQQSLTATDKKAILEADDKVATNQAVKKALEEALKLNDQANEGWFAGMRATLGNNLPDLMVPDFISSPESSAATTNLDNAVVGQALTQLKAVFGGNPTEGERKILLDLQGSSSQPKAVRKEIFDRAMRAADARLAINQREAEQLRGGTYYKPGGGATGGSPSGAGGNAPQVGTVMDGYKFKGGNPADPASWEKQ